MSFINKVVWSVAIPLIFINAIYFSFKLKFSHLNLKKLSKNMSVLDSSENISSKDALFISLASKLGAGSLAGISFAIYYGGIGTVFWIWVSTFFTSINCYIENILAIKYKKRGKCSFFGPSKYIFEGLKSRKIAVCYSFLAIIAYIVGFTSIQNNTIVSLAKNIISVNPVYISLFVAFLSIFLISKGIKKVSNVCNKIVPIMTIFYMVLGLVVLVLNIKNVPLLFVDIVKSAFNIRSGLSGLLYSFMLGIEKSIFATEAGVGTSAMASSLSDNNYALKQGYFGVVETFFINFVVTSVTSFILIFSNYSMFNFNNINGIEICKYSFFYHFGKFGEIFLLIILVLFAFSTIITCYYYGKMNFDSIFNDSKFGSLLLKVFTFVFLFLGGIKSSSVIWAIADTIVGLLAIINVYSMYKLRKEIILIDKSD